MYYLLTNFSRNWHLRVL